MKLSYKYSKETNQEDDSESLTVAGPSTSTTCKSSLEKYEDEQRRRFEAFLTKEKDRFAMETSAVQQALLKRATEDADAEEETAKKRRKKN